MSNANYRFQGILSTVSSDGECGWIDRATVQRKDGRELGLTLHADPFVYRRYVTVDPKEPDLRFHAGMAVTFLLGPDGSHPGKLVAEKVRLFSSLPPN